MPGAHWPDLLAQVLKAGGSRSSFGEFMDAVAGCQVGLVDVAGWLCDELRMGRVRIAAEVDLPPLTVRYERMADDA